MRTHPRAHPLCIGVVFLGLAAAPAGAQTPIFPCRRLRCTPGTNPIAQADFDLDGRADLAVGYASDSLFGTPTFVSVLLGSGTGLFAAPLDLAADKATITGVAAFDLNGDGKPDICATRYNPIAGIRTISVWLGDGAGHFGARSDLTLSSSPLSLAIADMDGDGVLDAVTGNAGTGARAKSSPSCSTAVMPPISPTYYSGSAPGVSVAAADLDGDGLRDVGLLGTTFFGSGSFSFVDIRRNLGGTGLGAGALGAATTLAVSGNERSLVFSDLDGDGDADGTLVTSDTNAGELRILRNDGTGAFTVEFHAYSGVGFGQAAADLDGDGVMDLAVADANFGQVDVFVGPLTAGFTNPVHYPVGQGARGISIGDVNGDGAPDVAATLTGSVALILSAPGGGFWTDPIYAVAEFAKKIAFGDLDGDGFADAVVAYAGQPILVRQPRRPERAPRIGLRNILGKDRLPRLRAGRGNRGARRLRWRRPPRRRGGKHNFVASAILQGERRGRPRPRCAVRDRILARRHGARRPRRRRKVGHRDRRFGGRDPLGFVGKRERDLRPAHRARRGERGHRRRRRRHGQRRPARPPLREHLGQHDLRILGIARRGFLPKADYATPGFPLSVAVGDTNYDARLDVAVACRTASVVSHRLNVGAGILGPHQLSDGGDVRERLLSRLERRWLA